MDDFLAATLADTVPEVREGGRAGFRWRWISAGILELTPVTATDRALVISAGITATKPRRWRCLIRC